MRGSDVIGARQRRRSRVHDREGQTRGSTRGSPPGRQGRGGCDGETGRHNPAPRRRDQGRPRAGCRDERDEPKLGVEGRVGVAAVRVA